MSGGEKRAFFAPLPQAPRGMADVGVHICGKMKGQGA